MAQPLLLPSLLGDVFNVLELRNPVLPFGASGSLGFGVLEPGPALGWPCWDTGMCHLLPVQFLSY